jgi:NADPH:quinone reductase-like Zn-dependent oxidoreductase
MGTRGEFEAMSRIFAEGKVKPVVDGVYPLSRVREAMDIMEEKRQFGKIVLRVD